MNKTEFKDRLKEILFIEEFNPDEKLEMDSLDLVEGRILIQDFTGKKISIEKMNSLNTANKIFKFIEM